MHLVNFDIDCDLILGFPFLQQGKIRSGMCLLMLINIVAAYAAKVPTLPNLHPKTTCLSGNRALQSLYKSLPLDDLDLFYGKVKLGCPYI